jgi:hypothetical protein
VNRGTLKDKPVEELATTPLPPEAIAEAWKGREPCDHVADLFAAMAARREPL